MNDELEKLLAAATPGPWQIVMARNDDGVTSYMIREHTHPSVVVERDQYWEDDYQPKTDADGYWLPDENMDAFPHRTGNAALIVAAVNALPELLERVKRLEEALKLGKIVMDMLDEHGPSIVPHLLDTDENAGQRFRAALKETGQ